MDIYKRYYTVEQVKKITGLVQPESINNKLLHPAYLGNGYFDKEKLDFILDYAKEKDWFVKQIELFVEYLNKIEEVSYSEIARRVKISFGVISSLRFGYKTAIKILVKFRKYTYGFDKYYNAK